MKEIYNKAMRSTPSMRPVYWKTQGVPPVRLKERTCCICGKTLKKSRYNADPLFPGKSCCKGCFDYVYAAQKYLNGIRKAAIKIERGLGL